MPSFDATMRQRLNVETRWKRDEETLEEWKLRTAGTCTMTAELQVMWDDMEAKKIRKRNEKTCGFNPVICYGAAFLYGLLVIFQLWTFSSSGHLIPHIL